MIAENKDEAPFRKVLVSPGRASIKNSPVTGMSYSRVNISATAASTPHRNGLLENRYENFEVNTTSIFMIRIGCKAVLIHSFSGTCNLITMKWMGFFPCG